MEVLVDGRGLVLSTIGMEVRRRKQSAVTCYTVHVRSNVLNCDGSRRFVPN